MTSKNQFNIIMYIIYKNFTDILSILKKHYINDDNLLLNILDGMEFKDRYLEVIENIIDFEDIYDYVKEKGGPYFEMLTAEIESKTKH